MKEQTLLEMKNKVEALARVVQHLLHETNNLRELSVGTLETLKLMDGYEAAKEIRKRELGTNRHIPIIAMTAYAAEEDEGRCLSVGMDDYLAKPVKLDALRDRLEYWVQADLNKRA